MDYITINELREFIGRGTVKAKDAERLIHQASRHIDSLTFGRINKYGFENLTEFQKAIIKESTALLVKFEDENEDEINTFLSSYSINGVSMSFGDGNKWNLKVINGVAISTDIFNLLSQSGLTTLSLRI